MLLFCTKSCTLNHTEADVWPPQGDCDPQDCAQHGPVMSLRIPCDWRAFLAQPNCRCWCMCDREIGEVEPLQELLDVWLQMKPYSPWDGFVVKPQKLFRSSQIFDWKFSCIFSKNLSYVGSFSVLWIASST